MGLVILLAVGGILGWLSSIVLAVKNSRAIMLYVAASVLGALVAGLIATPISILEAITPVSVLIGALGAIGSLAVAHIIRQQLPSNS